MVKSISTDYNNSSFTDNQHAEKYNCNEQRIISHTITIHRAIKPTLTKRNFTDSNQKAMPTLIITDNN